MATTVVTKSSLNVTSGSSQSLATGSSQIINTSATEYAVVSAWAPSGSNGLLTMGTAAFDLTVIPFQFSIPPSTTVTLQWLSGGPVRAVWVVYGNT